jgi:DNA modification methylase
MRELLDAGKNYTELKNLCVWNKTNGGMGSLYRSKHELVFIFKHGTKAHINNVELGKNGRYRTNVWDYAGVNTFQNTKDLDMHPTVKPAAMIKDAIMDCTKRGDIVLDVFGGSGSTLIAAEDCNRKAYLMEIDPGYVDVILQRYWDHTGIEPVHENGSTFFEIMEARSV